MIYGTEQKIIKYLKQTFHTDSVFMNSETVFSNSKTEVVKNSCSSESHVQKP